MFSLRRKQVAAKESEDGWLLLASASACNLEALAANGEPGHASGLAAQSWKIVGLVPLIQ
jgi:hypothetical protein